MIPFEVEPGLYSPMILIGVFTIFCFVMCFILKDKRIAIISTVFLLILDIAMFSTMGFALLSGSAYPETITVCTHNSNTLVGTNQQVYSIINDGITPLKIHDGETIHAYIIEYGGILNHLKLIEKIDEPLVCRNTSICGV